MANICSFKMRVKGKYSNIQSFYKAMIQEGDIWMGRGAEADIDYESDGVAEIIGWCKWSVVSSLIDNAIDMRTNPNKWDFTQEEKERLQFITLWEACEKWQLDMEVYSEEGGCQFQEHFGYINGEIIYQECVDWEEYELWDYETKEEAEEELETKFTDEEWNDRDDRVTRGGFEWKFDF